MQELTKESHHEAIVRTTHVMYVPMTVEIEWIHVTYVPMRAETAEPIQEVMKEIHARMIETEERTIADKK
jgi:hypothetical protein